METSLHDYVIKKLKNRPRDLSYEDIALATGMKEKTVSRIARRESKNPRVGNIEKLAVFFRTKEGEAA